jgi:hypothetical protein
MIEILFKIMFGIGNCNETRCYNEKPRITNTFFVFIVSQKVIMTIHSKHRNMMTNKKYTIHTT